MQNDELKFLLRLLGCPNYRSSLTANGFNNFRGRDKICKALGDRELIDYSREIASVKILPPGRALLKMDASQVPISDKERQVLEKIAKTSGKIEPSKISIKTVKSAERDAILQNFHSRGLIAVETQRKKQKAEIWLTQRGLEYLRDEFTAKGTHPIISLDLLTNYLRFLRKSLRPRYGGDSPMLKPNDEEVLQIIRGLDQQLGAKNYLPIFHLREKLQPPLSREELDQILYRLENDNRIELSTLVEASRYSQEQINAGIQQRSGSPLFFIKVTAH